MQMGPFCSVQIQPAILLTITAGNRFYFMETGVGNRYGSLISWRVDCNIYSLVTNFSMGHAVT